MSPAAKRRSLVGMLVGAALLIGFLGGRYSGGAGASASTRAYLPAATPSSSASPASASASAQASAPGSAPASVPGPALPEADAHTGSQATAPAQTAGQILYWYDPMEPAQHFDHPGKSPFMDMQLVPKYAEPANSNSNSNSNSNPNSNNSNSSNSSNGSNSSNTSSNGSSNSNSSNNIIGARAPGASQDLSLTAGATQNLGLRLARVERGVSQASLSLPAVVQFNDRDVALVQIRSAGFVQKVYRRAINDVLAEGAPLVDLLIPEWAGAQEEFLAVLRTGDQALTSAARQRLGLLGMSDDLIERVASRRQVEPVLTLYAPLDGVLTELNARSGMALAQGTTIARINGIHTVWVEAALPEAESGAVQIGQTVQIALSASPGEVRKGKVSALLPQADAASRTLRLRVELPNPGARLRPGQFAQVQLLHSDAALTLLVPSEAVIRTGVRNLVMLSTGEGHFRPVEVKVGQDSGDHTVILSGLHEGDTVVASGQFLLDSEATLRGVVASPSAGSVDRITGQSTGTKP